MMLYTEARLIDIIEHWAKDYTSTDPEFDIKVVRNSVDQATGKVLFVLEKTEKGRKDE